MNVSNANKHAMPPQADILGRTIPAATASRSDADDDKSDHELHRMASTTKAMQLALVIFALLESMPIVKFICHYKCQLVGFSSRMQASAEHFHNAVAHLWIKAAVLARACHQRRSQNNLRNLLVVQWQLCVIDKMLRQIKAVVRRVLVRPRTAMRRSEASTRYSTKSDALTRFC